MEIISTPLFSVKRTVPLTSERIANDILQYYYQATIGYGDYYSLPAVHQRIQETAWRRSKKERLYNWLRLIAQAGSFTESSDCFLRGVYLNDEPQTWEQGSKRTLADYIESCKDERINIVTILEDSEIDWLPNPIPKNCANICHSQKTNGSLFPSSSREVLGVGS